MKVHITSKAQFDETLKKHDVTDENVSLATDTIFISIVGSGHGENSHFKREHDNVLVMKFDDITDEEYVGLQVTHPGIMLFDETHAKRLHEFVKKHQNARKCIVHCSAGVSRSGAVGTYINDVYGEDNFFDFSANNKHILPNAYILATLRRHFYQESTGGKVEGYGDVKEQ